MKCKETQKMLMDYLDGVLPKEEMSRISRHLAECSECHALYEKIRESWSMAKADRLDSQPFFHTRVRQALENRRSSGSGEWRKLARQALQPALFFVVLGLGIFIGVQLGRGIDSPSLVGNQGQPPDYIEEYAENQYLDGMKLETLEQEMFLEDSSYTAVPSDKTDNDE
jgi:predicted anti-sigma-YlaC factor YlaD